MDERDRTLWRMEEEFWSGGPDVYHRNLSDDSLMVFQAMVLTRSQTLDAIAAGPRWTAVRFDDQRTVGLTDDVVALNYRVSARRDADPNPYSAIATSVYVRRDGRWQLALHQQTA
jgi:Domain of unknown function (DUF4440)